MSKYYVIGVGGTGTKCVEAFVHLCAMGAVQSAETVEIRIVDIDEDGGNYHRLLEVINNYDAARGIVQKIKNEKGSEGSKKWFGPNLSTGIQFTWSTREDTKQSNYCLDDLITASQGDEKQIHLMHALFSKKEREMELKQGARGIPRIGSLLCAKGLDLYNMDSFWRELFGGAAMAGADEKRVIVFGSLFGGTGASCTPTIVKRLKNWADDKHINLKVGMGLMLPYFCFDSDGKIEASRLRAESDMFIMNSKAALQYYKETDVLDKAYNLYCFGDKIDDKVRKVDFALGQRPQKNDAMPVEILAGEAIADFLFSNLKEGSFRYVKRLRDGDTDDAPYRWEQFPDGQTIQGKMANLLRFAMVFNNYFFAKGSAAKDIQNMNCFSKFFGKDTFTDGGKRSAWIKNFAPVKAYCDYFLAWAVQLKTRGLKMLDPNMLLPAIDKETGLPLAKDIEGVVADISIIAGGSDSKKRARPTWDMILNNMAGEKHDSSQASHYSDFVNRLYAQCEN